MASIISAGTTSATALNMSADTTGILQLASNNGTVALTVATNQNIGIGTSPGSGRITLTQTGTNLTLIGNGNTTPDGADPWLATGNNATWSSATFGWSMYDSNADGSLQIYRRAGTTTGSLVMRMDRTFGYVNMPSQPMFVANGNQGTYVSVANGANLTLNTTRLNISSSYNTSTYTFTAPVSGRYLFIVTMYMQGGSGGSLFDFLLNGGTYQRMSFQVGSGDLSYFGQCVASMSAGDTMRVQNSTGSSRAMFIATDLHTAFSGYLIS
jgi:hypothetical protein